MPLSPALPHAGALPGYLFGRLRSALRLNRNLFVMARKEAGPDRRETVEE